MIDSGKNSRTHRNDSSNRQGPPANSNGAVQTPNHTIHSQVRRKRGRSLNRLKTATIMGTSRIEMSSINIILALTLPKPTSFGKNKKESLEQRQQKKSLKSSTSQGLRKSGKGSTVMLRRRIGMETPRRRLGNEVAIRRKRMSSSRTCIVTLRTGHRIQRRIPKTKPTTTKIRCSTSSNTAASGCSRRTRKCTRSTPLAITAPSIQRTEAFKPGLIYLRAGTFLTST